MLFSVQNFQCLGNGILSSSFSSYSNNQFRSGSSRFSCLSSPICFSQLAEKNATVDYDDGKHCSTSAERGDSDGDGGSGIHVTRHSYVPVSKSELLDAIIDDMFASQQEDAQQFRRLSRCLDLIIHAEHKKILEEMRGDHSLSSKEDNGWFDEFFSMGSTFVANYRSSARDMNLSTNTDSLGKEHEEGPDSEMPLPSKLTLNLKQLVGSSLKTIQRYGVKNSRDVIPVHFQREFMKLLYSAGFEELSLRDLMLSSTLNTDYLLTLPIYVDWKRASESSTIIFRRGYCTERQKGLLIGEKLDYLQSKLLQSFLLLISRPLGRFAIWLNRVFRSTSQTHIEVLANKLKFWFKDFPAFLQPSYDENEIFNEFEGDDLLSCELPIWTAAQKAVRRYESILSAVGPRERLFRKFLASVGLEPSKPKQASDLDFQRSCSESYLSSKFIPRITISDIWRPASLKNCGNDFWKMLRTSASVLTSQSILQEPAFQELILLYTEEIEEKEISDQSALSSLQMKIYERIPIPDLPVVFPHKKLSFRILDAVRLDVATLLGLLAYFLSYKFEDILSSPSALLLDVIAASALVIYVFRVLLGYKQTRDRYQLLVNRTLYEKTIASGFGCIHFLLDASAQQQFKEAILVYAIILKTEERQVTDLRTITDECERFICNNFQERVEMAVDKAVETLTRLGLVNYSPIDEQVVIQAVSCSNAYTILQKRWNCLIH